MYLIVPQIGEFLEEMVPVDRDEVVVPLLVGLGVEFLVVGLRLENIEVVELVDREELARVGDELLGDYSAPVHAERRDLTAARGGELFELGGVQVFDEERAIFGLVDFVLVYGLLEEDLFVDLVVELRQSLVFLVEDEDGLQDQVEVDSLFLFLLGFVDLGVELRVFELLGEGVEVDSEGNFYLLNETALLVGPELGGIFDGEGVFVDDFDGSGFDPIHLFHAFYFVEANEISCVEGVRFGLIEVDDSRVTSGDVLNEIGVGIFAVSVIDFESFIFFFFEERG